MRSFRYRFGFIVFLLWLSPAAAAVWAASPPSCPLPDVLSALEEPSSRAAAIDGQALFRRLDGREIRDRKGGTYFARLVPLRSGLSEKGAFRVDFFTARREPAGDALVHWKGNAFYLDAIVFENEGTGLGSAWLKQVFDALPSGSTIHLDSINTPTTLEVRKQIDRIRARPEYSNFPERARVSYVNRELNRWLDEALASNPREAPVWAKLLHRAGWRKIRMEIEAPALEEDAKTALVYFTARHP